ncbi:MAG TPA: sugar phosphate nucleotidyltransferase [Candidatus Hydrogenedentes bacterium]|mgnify:CR=1 FL=1|nr:sugar phosphate nucleotidyltransferase [Candidatus Hydrogenedentota bacterium]
MSTATYQGVILAAGHGSRMGPFGEQVPKPIAPICNKPLLLYQLEHLKSLGVEDVIIVIGHLGHRIQETLGDGSAYDVNIRYVEQEKRLGLAHAVGQIEPHVDRPFILLLGDIFFDVPNLALMPEVFENHPSAAVLAVKEEKDPEAVKKNFNVYLRGDNTVRRVIEKPRHIENLLKGCGLYLFDLPIFDAIRRTPRTALRDEYELTDSIQILIDLEYAVRVARVVEWDMNITYINDLIDCCVYQLDKLGKTSLIGANCTIPSGTELIHSVLGDNVTLTHPATLERCVALSGAAVPSGHHKNTVFTPDTAWNA